MILNQTQSDKPNKNLIKVTDKIRQLLDLKIDKIFDQNSHKNDNLKILHKFTFNKN